jgi:hypothetical protein
MLQEWLIVFGIMLVPTCGALIGLWLGALRRARRAEAILQQIALTSAVSLPTAPKGEEANQASLQQLVLDVERIAEGQRFVTRLLAERAQRPQAPELPRSITPH